MKKFGNTGKITWRTELQMDENMCSPCQQTVRLEEKRDTHAEGREARVRCTKIWNDKDPLQGI
jgi:hypothetical protein